MKDEEIVRINELLIYAKNFKDKLHDIAKSVDPVIRDIVATIQPTVEQIHDYINENKDKIKNMEQYLSTEKKDTDK